MILRRITEHVREQNWTAVFLDFIIVVVGVFIGIQVSNWNDARLQEQTATNYIDRLREDLAENQQDMAQRITYFTRVRDSALAALTALDQDRENLGEQFLIDIYQASHILPRDVGRDTYDEILSVGANEAIADVAVRKRLANFYRSIRAQINNLGRTTPYRDIVRRNLTYEAHVAIRDNCGDIITTDTDGIPHIRLPEQCDPNLSAEEIDAAVQSILALDITNDLVRRLTDLDAKLGSMKLISERAALLDAYLAELD